MEPPILHIPPHGRRVVHAQTEEAINAEIYTTTLYPAAYISSQICSVSNYKNPTTALRSAEKMSVDKYIGGMLPLSILPSNPPLSSELRQDRAVLSCLQLVIIYGYIHGNKK
jgi:hypothetical protein